MNKETKRQAIHEEMIRIARNPFKICGPLLGHIQAHTPADYQSLEKSYVRLRA